MGQGVLRIPYTDKESGRVFQIPWNSDKSPTQWDLQAAAEEIKKAESFRYPERRGASPFSPIAPELEIGNKVADRAAREEAKPVFKSERREDTISPTTPSIWDRFKRNVLHDTDPATGRNPVVSRVAGWYNKNKPSEVEDFAQWSNLPKAKMAGLAGNLASDATSPASIAFNLVGARGAQQWAKGASAANKARKTAKVAKPLITADVVETLRTAPFGSPEWLQAANRSLKAIDVDIAPGVDLSEMNAKLIPRNTKGIQEAERLAEQAKATGGKIKGRKLKQSVLQQVDTDPAQGNLDLFGKAIKKGPDVGPDARHVRGVTIKLKDKQPDFTKDILPVLQSMVDRRNSGDMVREMVGRQFGSLKEKGLQGILEYNSGNREGLYAELQKMMDKDWLDRKIVGDVSKYKSSYLPQMWDNTPEEIQKVFGLKKPPKEMKIGGGEPTRRAGINPSFTKKSFFQAYVDGMNAGLKPKHDNIVDLVADYMVRSNKYQADKSNINFLKANKLVVKEGSKAARAKGYEAVPGLPTFRGKDGTIGHWVADPNVAKYLNNYYGSPGPVSKFVGNWSNISKAIAMGAGAPHTILNAHGFNIGKAAWDMGGVKGLKDYLTTGITQKGAKKGYEAIFNDPKKLKDLLDLSRRGYVGNIAEDFRNLGGKTGLAFGDELRASKNPFKKVIGKAEGLLSEHVEKSLFGYKLPATKARFALDRLDELMAQGLSREKALKRVAEDANTGFGGMNFVRNYNPTQLNPLKSGGLSRSVDQGLRGILLAPDWSGRNLSLGKKVYGSLFAKNPDPMYARIATQNAMLRNAIRAQTSNQLSDKQLDEQRSTEGMLTPIGTTQGGQRRRELNTVGTSTEWMRLPNQALMDLQKGGSPEWNKLIQNRFNPLTRNFMTLFTNQDYNGNPIYTKDRWNNPIPWTKSAMNSAKYMLAPFTHPVVNNAIDFGMGNIGLEQALAQSFELPLNYRYISQGRGRTRTNPFNFGANGGLGNIGKSFKFGGE